MFMRKIKDKERGKDKDSDTSSMRSSALSSSDPNAFDIEKLTEFEAQSMAKIWKASEKTSDRGKL